jgi:hypothetical protein
VNAHELLIAARSLIETPEKWTQGVGARSVFGDQRSALSPEAVCFCADGALYRAGEPDFGGPIYNLAVRALNRSLVGEGSPYDPYNYIEFNDAGDTTHADVLAMFDRAISATKDAAG